ncbi:hypothetical protein JQX13_45695 [Archangium violaceum]|uniref:TfuA-like protein n=1 Tax=Archangium violaceum TaxID=83451 RepID=UPI00193AF128|nr:TfuA-like protein [Archangium violaceum]QRK07264.1 hypothetical protein JQX13_45695 [Archangium violaceum]
MIYVFVGPTLSVEEARAELDAVFLPPAAQGDVYRTACERPEAIGLIDGYFERTPAVWHKEILWAMAEGIHVYGSASMGALRAAELASFGMRGVGATFEAFLHGDLEDDDEVAVVHAPAEEGYRPLSEAMVNIRATLASAERAGVVRLETRATLERIAKGLHYPERCYPALLAQASREGVPAVELERLRSWLPRGRINQKREDALAMLRDMREELANHPGPKKVTYSLSRTDAWEEARRRSEQLSSTLEGQGGEPLRESLLEELRISGTFPRARRGALLRALAVEEAMRQGHAVREEELREVCDTFRRERGLLEAERFERWLEEQHVEDEVSFFEGEFQVRRIEALLEPEIAWHLPDHLRSTGEYGSLLERVRRKEQVLAGSGLERPGLAEAGLSEEELWEWYFQERLERPVPADIDVYARAQGFADEDALRRAVLRERCFLLPRHGHSHESGPTPTHGEQDQAQQGQQRLRARGGTAPE